MPPPKRPNRESINAVAARFAGILGLTAFAAIQVRSLLHARAVEAALLSSMGGLFLFAAVGWVLGALAQFSVEDAVYTRIASEADANRTATEPVRASGE